MHNNNIAIGTCDGTGAAIKVVLGWAPRYVKVFNLEDAGNLSPALEWIKGMELVSATDEGVLLTGLSDTDMDRTLETANGIAEYAGGDILTYDESDARWETSAAADASELYVDGYWEKESGGASYRNAASAKIPKPFDGQMCIMGAGFEIGADANLNADGEQLVWIAMR